MKSADTVTGHYDVVAVIEVADIDAVGTVVKHILCWGLQDYHLHRGEILSPKSVWRLI